MSNTSDEPDAGFLDSDLIVAGDLGGTNFRTALIDRAGRLHYRTSTQTNAEKGPAVVIEMMVGQFRAAIERAGNGRILAVSTTAPGPLDPWSGLVFQPPNLPGWNEVPLRDILEERLGKPAFVSNDANAAALAEHRFGAGRGTRHLIYVTVSTGVGGGVITNDRLLLGAHGASGEIGHIVVDPAGPRCNCGNRGCVESLASGPAITSHFIDRMREGRDTTLAGLPIEQITTTRIVMAAESGDGLAIDVLAEAGRWLGIAIANMLHLFDPEIVVIGGGVSKAGELIFAPMRAEIDQRTMEHFRENYRIAMASLGDDVCLYGAAAIGFAALEEDAG